MKALSVRAPWWWFILHGKPIENRGWPTRFRGRLFLHASRTWVREDVALDCSEATDMARRASLHVADPDWAAMRAAGGCLVGTMEIVDCVTAHPSPFFVGPYGFVLRNVTAFAQPIPFKGALGLFDVPASLLPGGHS